jgi:hypothetical protein
VLLILGVAVLLVGQLEGLSHVRTNNEFSTQVGDWSDMTSHDDAEKLAMAALAAQCCTLMAPHLNAQALRARTLGRKEVKRPTDSVQSLH